MDWIYRSALHISAEGDSYEVELGGRLGGVHAADGEAYRVTCSLPDASHSIPKAGFASPVVSKPGHLAPGLKGS